MATLVSESKALVIMFNTDRNIPNTPENKWRIKLDRFVQANQQELAALAWGLQQEWGDLDNTLGLDLKPKPHFVVCSRESLETLNKNVNGQIQEILGILDGYKRDEEVAIIAIGEGQIKLIHFQPKLTPASCFEEVQKDVDRLIELLESRLEEHLVGIRD
jgi:AAA+ ATPase superfamily predicted ATPase